MTKAAEDGRSGRFADATLDHIDALAENALFRTELRALAEDATTAPLAPLIQPVLKWLRTGGDGALIEERFARLIAYVMHEAGETQKPGRWRTLRMVIDGLNPYAALAEVPCAKCSAKASPDGVPCSTCAARALPTGVPCQTSAARAAVRKYLETRTAREPAKLVPFTKEAQALWLKARGDFDAAVDARSVADGQRDALALAFALNHRLPLDLQRVLDLADRHATFDGDDESSWLFEALGFDLFLRHDSVGVTPETEWAFQAALDKARTEEATKRPGPATAGSSAKALKRYRTEATEHVEPPAGYVASPKGLDPMEWSPIGKRAYSTASTAPAESSEPEVSSEPEESSETTPERSFLRREIERGRHSTVLPDDVLRRVAAAAATASLDNKVAFTKLAAAWRVLRFTSDPGAAAIKSWEASIKGSEPIWELLGFAAAMKKVAKWDGDRDEAYGARRPRGSPKRDFALYIPVNVHAYGPTYASIPHRELIEPIAQSIARWFDARKYRANLGE